MSLLELGTIFLFALLELACLLLRVGVDFLAGLFMGDAFLAGLFMGDAFLVGL